MDLWCLLYLNRYMQSCIVTAINIHICIYLYLPADRHLPQWVIDLFHCWFRQWHAPVPHPFVTLGGNSFLSGSWDGLKYAIGIWDSWLTPDNGIVDNIKINHMRSGNLKKTLPRNRIQQIVYCNTKIDALPPVVPDIQADTLPPTLPDIEAMKKKYS